MIFSYISIHLSMMYSKVQLKEYVANPRIPGHIPIKESIQIDNHSWA